MSLNILKRFSARPTSLFRHQVPRPTTALHRSYVATNQSSPGHSSNVSNPQAGSVEGQQVNQSRATDSQSSPDTASTANPVSNPAENGLGQQEEGTDPVKQDPKKSDAEK
ncbi:hypothetical protein LTR16_002811, partial [Cryomyces antarcticus]